MRNPGPSYARLTRYASPAPSRRRLDTKRPLVVAGAVLLIATTSLVLLLARASSHVSSKPSRATPTAPDTPAGAVVAATAYVNGFDYHVMLDASRRRALLARFAAPGAIPALDAQLTDGIGALRASVASGHVVSSVALLGYRLDEFTPLQASVSIWGVLLFGTAIDPPRSLWRTSTVDLIWTHGGWRVRRHVGRNGPSAAWSIGKLASVSRTFRGYRDVP